MSEVWTDHLPALFRTPIYQDKLADPGDPLFWPPLIALHVGLRSEEILQLSPDDIQTRDAIGLSPVSSSGFG